MSNKNVLSSSSFAKYEKHISTNSFEKIEKDLEVFSEEKRSDILFYSAYYNYPDICQIILDIGKYKIFYNQIGQNALHIAAGKNYYKICEALIKNNIDIEAADDNGMTPLFYAAHFNNIEICKLLIKNGANIEITNNTGTKLLFHAGYLGNYEICKLFLKNGIDINSINRFDETLLHISAGDGNHEFCKFLIKNGAKINSQDGIGDTPLHIAIQNNDLELVEILIKRNANVKIENDCRKTPLYLAAEIGNEKIFALLMKNAIPHDGIKEKISLKSQLLQLQRIIKAKDAIGDTLLHTAAKHGNLEICKLLIALRTENKENYLELRNFRGETPLHLAAKYGHAEICKLLLKTNKRRSYHKLLNCDGKTPLNLAVEYDHEDVFELLIEKQTKRTILEKILKRPRHFFEQYKKNDSSMMHIAARSGNLKICQSLISHLKNKEGSINDQDENCIRPLEYSVLFGDVEMCNFLIENGANVELEVPIDITSFALSEEFTAINKDEKTSLICIAAALGNATILQILIKQYKQKNLDFKKPDISGFTALDYAADFGNFATYSMLKQEGLRCGNAGIYYGIPKILNWIEDGKNALKTEVDSNNNKKTEERIYDVPPNDINLNAEKNRDATAESEIPTELEEDLEIKVASRSREMHIYKSKSF